MKMIQLSSLLATIAVAILCGAMRAEARDDGLDVEGGGAALAPETQEITGLVGGFNLVSFQVLPESPSVESVFAELSPGGIDRLLSVWCYEAALGVWIAWRKPGTPGSELNGIPGVGFGGNLRYNEGYWIELAAGANYKLTVTGNRPSNGRIVFRQGWNLVGFDASAAGEFEGNDIPAVFGSHLDPSALNPAQDSDVQTVFAFLPGLAAPQRFDVTNDRPVNDSTAGLPAGNEPIENVTSDTLATFVRGYGYWVYANHAFTLEPRIRVTLPGDAAVAAGLPFPQPQDIDYDADGKLDQGTWVAGVDPPDGEPGADLFQQVVRFSGPDRVRSVLLSNAGTGILRWSAEVEDAVAAPWLFLGFQRDATGQAVLDPDGERIRLFAANGLATAEADDLAIHVDPDGLLPNPEPDGYYEGRILVKSGGGERRIYVRLHVSPLVGDWEGRVTVGTVNGARAAMPLFGLALSLSEDANGRITVRLPSNRNLILPAPVGIDIDSYGTDLGGSRLSDGLNRYAMSGALYLPAAPQDRTDILNPNPFVQPLIREFFLDVTRVAEDRLEGSYQETVHGLLSEPLKLAGGVSFSRKRTAPSFLQASAGVFTPAIPPVIPESPSVLEETRTIAKSLRIRTLSVTVDVEHPRTADLEITLIGPANPQREEVRLFQRTPGVNLNVTWPRDRHPPAGPGILDQAFVGDIARGAWTLRIKDADSAPGGSGGKLRSWRLDIDGEEVFTVKAKVVRSGTPQGIGGVTAILTGAQVIHHSMSTSDGSLAIPGVPRGYYRLSLSKPGYASAEVPVKLLLLDSSAPPSFDIVDLGSISLESRAPTGSPTLRAAPGSGVAPLEVTLIYRAIDVLDGDRFNFTLQRYETSRADLENPSDGGFNGPGSPPVAAGGLIQPPEVLLPETRVALALPGIYSAKVTHRRSNGVLVRILEPPVSLPAGTAGEPLAIVVLPGNADQVPGSNVVLDGVFSGAGVLPAALHLPPVQPMYRYTFLANPGDPLAAVDIITGQHFFHREDLPDCATHDIDRPPLGGPAGPEDTDVRISPTDPPLSTVTDNNQPDGSRLRISQIHTPGLDIPSNRPLGEAAPIEPDPLRPRYLHMTCNFGAQITGFGQAGSFTLVAGPRVFPVTQTFRPQAKGRAE